LHRGNKGARIQRETTWRQKGEKKKRGGRKLQERQTDRGSVKKAGKGKKEKGGSPVAH